MQFAVTAYDYQDEDTINRRLSNRDAHVQGIEKLVKAGIFLSGGAMLNEDGKMIGSSVHVDFNTREALDEWIQNDPYITGKVWEKVDIREIKLVPIANILNGQ
ncbi:hypothetical protein CBF23_005475 [Marinomonas agarivorans]|nr:hypothetical protein CBF23_005475 [Marinomonas agarivorans]